MLPEAVHRGAYRRSVRAKQGIFFRLHFSVFRTGSRGTFVLCTASSRCTRIAGPGAAMYIFLAQILLTNKDTWVPRMYT